MPNNSWNVIHVISSHKKPRAGAAIIILQMSKSFLCRTTAAAQSPGCYLHSLGRQAALCQKG
jgi:hypothetical protein